MSQIVKKQSPLRGKSKHVGERRIFRRFAIRKKRSNAEKCAEEREGAGKIEKKTYELMSRRQVNGKRVALLWGCNYNFLKVQRGSCGKKKKKPSIKGKTSFYN